MEIERTLTKLSAKVLKGWNERQSQTELEKAASAAFSEEFDWGPDQDKVGHPPLKLSYINVCRLRWKNMERRPKWMLFFTWIA